MERHFDAMEKMGYDYDLGELSADFLPDPYAEEEGTKSILSEIENEDFLENRIDYDEFF